MPRRRTSQRAVVAVITALVATPSVPVWADQASGGDVTEVAGVSAISTISPADWIYQPKPFAMFNFLPGRFIKPGISGKVVLKCRVLPTSLVSDCSVVSDTGPEGVLGAAALKASALFKIKPRTVNGTLSDNAWVLIPLSYNLGPMRGL